MLMMMMMLLLLLLLLLLALELSVGGEVAQQVARQIDHRLAEEGRRRRRRRRLRCPSGGGGRSGGVGGGVRFRQRRHGGRVGRRVLAHVVNDGRPNLETPQNPKCTQRFTPSHGNLGRLKTGIFSLPFPS